MPEYATIKSQVQQARSQLEAQKRTVESEEERIRKQEKLLSALQTKKPQRKLMFQASPKYHSQLQRHESEQRFKQKQRPIIEEAKKKIKDYRTKTLSPYESQVSKAEGEIRTYEQEKHAFESAQKMFRKKIPYTMVTGPEHKYLKKMYRSESMAKQSFAKKVKALQTQLPSGEKLIVDWQKMSVGIESGALQMSFPSLKDYSQEIGRTAPPQFAYKDPITGQLSSYAPAFAPKGFVPVAIGPKGKELPFAEQIKFRGGRPGLFPSQLVPYTPPIEKVAKDPKKLKFYYKEIAPGEYIPRGVVEPPPTLKEQWKKATAGGLLGLPIISGGLGFIHGKAAAFYQRGEIKKMREKEIPPYQLDISSQIVGGVAVAAPFAIPYVGSGLLVGLATEHVFTKRGRKEIKEAEKWLGEWEIVGDYKMPKKVAKGVAWSIPAIEVGLGTARWWYPKVKGLYATRGRVEIPTQKLVPPKVLEGKEAFPTAPTKKHLELFEKGKYWKVIEKPPIKPSEWKPGGFHAFPEPWKELKVARGESQFPGAYISYGVSPHFLKMPKYGMPKSLTDYIFGDIYGAMGKPGVMAIQPTRFKRGRIGKPGEAFVPGVKTEVEAIIPPETLLAKVSEKHYFKWKGRRVPIDKYIALSGKEVTEPTLKMPKLKDIEIDYRGVYDYRPYTLDMKSILYPGVSRKVSLRRRIKEVSRTRKLREKISEKVSIKKIERDVMMDVLRPSKPRQGKGYYPSYKPYYPRYTPAYFPSWKPSTKKVFPPPFWFDIDFKEKVKKKLRKRKQWAYAYTPSFTARALGIKPIKIKTPNVMKLLKKMRTGLEIRAPVVVAR